MHYYYTIEKMLVQNLQQVAEFPETDLIYKFDKTEFFNRLQSIESIALAILERNIQSKIGNVDYTKGGEKGLRIKAISLPFVDNFLISKETPAAFIKGRCKNVNAGADNTLLYNLLGSLGVPNKKIRIKAVGIEKEKEIYRQRYKVACADCDPEIILHALKQPELADNKYKVEDVDVTIDCYGIFKKDELKEELIDKHGFVLKGEGGDLARENIILDNDNTVGKNCLTFMGKNSKNIVTRYKIYNKFAQSLESGAVRDKLGTHIWDWVNNPEERLRETIPKSLEFGFTRLELTYYNAIPDLYMAKQDLSLLGRYLHPDIYYKNPIANQWRSFAEHLISNTMVYIPKTREVYLGLWFNECTRKIGGYRRKKAEPKEFLWMLVNNTLNLPINVFYIDFEEKEVDKKKDLGLLNIGVKTFIKRNPQPTRLMEKTYIYKSLSAKHNDVNQPKSMGLVDIGNIKLEVYTKKVDVRNKISGELEESEDTYKPNFLSTEQIFKLARKEKRKSIRDELYANALAVKSKIDEKREKITKLKIEQEKKREKELERKQEVYNALYKGDKIYKLVDAEIGSKLHIVAVGYGKGKYDYTILLAEDGNCYYGNKFINLILLQGNESYKPFLQRMDEQYRSRKEHKRREMWYMEPKQILFTVIVEDVKFSRYAASGNKYAFCKFLANRNIIDIEDVEDKIKEEVKELQGELKELEQETELEKDFTYIGKPKDLIKICALNEDESIKVVALQKIKFRGKDSYIIKSEDNKFYKSNYWSTKKIEAITQKNKDKRFCIITDGIRTTPSKNKERNVSLLFN